MIKKNILIIASSSVAIIKLPKVIELLKEDHNVKVIMTKAAKKGWSESSKYETVDEVMDLSLFPEHIKVSKWADLTLVLPATTNTIAKFHAGIADNFALSTLLATRKPIIFVPAMNTFMYQKLLKRNIIDNLSKDGHMFIGPTYGKLREGETGMGRMSEPEEIVKIVNNYLNPKKCNILIPYGHSIVEIDPIRFISNKSSGLMGQYLANELRLLGYKVHDVNINKYTNQEFLEYSKTLEFDIYISVAAFADFNVIKFNNKIKKGSINTINLVNNIDVLSELKKQKTNAKFIAFKLDEDKKNAINKMRNLGLDGIVWNKINTIGSKTSTGSFILKDQEIEFKDLTKKELAKKIAQKISKL